MFLSTYFIDGSSGFCSLWRVTKSEHGLWRFDGDPGVLDQFVVIRQNKPIDSLISLVREEFLLSPHIPLVLTYQLPPSMLVPNGAKSPPHNIQMPTDVEMMMSIHKWTTE